MLSHNLKNDLLNDMETIDFGPSFSFAAAVTVSANPTAGVAALHLAKARLLPTSVAVAPQSVADIVANNSVHNNIQQDQQ